MKSFNIHEAKTHLSELIAQVERGEDVIIKRAGKPVAKLSSYVEDKRKLRVPGSLEGKIRMAPDFDAYDAEIQRMFDESEIFPTET